MTQKFSITTFSCFLILLTGIVSCSGHIHSVSENKDVSSTVYIESENPAQDVEAALKKAKDSNRNLIVILGAQWCHDSRGLAANFATAQMKQLLKQHYEVIYVDVGYFKDLRNITQRFGQAHYFATPTVMIIEPVSQTLLNDIDMNIWGHADSIELADYVAYFTRYSDKTSASQYTMTNDQKELIEAFKLAQGERLMLAYSKLIPGMKTEDATQEANQVFIDEWNQVKRFRVALQEDILTLYQQASIGSTLVFPEYPPFSWE